MVQASSTLQPQISFNGVNGRPVVQFDGVDDIMDGLSGGSLRQNISANYQITGVPTTNRWIDIYAGQPGISGTRYTLTGAPGGAPFASPVENTILWNDLNNAPGGADTSWRVITNTGYYAQSTAFSTRSASTFNQALDGVTLGARFGPTGGSTFTLDGYIAEVLIYSNALTLTEQSSVESYLFQEWFVVPEPSTLLLLLAGGGMLRWWQRRRR